MSAKEQANKGWKSGKGASRSAVVHIVVLHCRGYQEGFSHHWNMNILFQRSFSVRSWWEWQPKRTRQKKKKRQGLKLLQSQLWRFVLRLSTGDGVFKCFICQRCDMSKQHIMQNRRPLRLNHSWAETQRENLLFGLTPWSAATNPLGCLPVLLFRAELKWLSFTARLLQTLTKPTQRTL